LKKEEIKDRLPAKMPHSTLNLILDYLKASKKIVQTQKGVSWVFEDGPQERRIIEELEREMRE
jgi:sulfur transfer complex TusBCD TusB component (DsrH family)